MSCNRCATTAEAVAPVAGAGHVEAGWAENRSHAGKVCPVCRNCFLRADGGCTKCEDGLLDKARQQPERYEARYRQADYPERVMTELAPVMVHSRDGTVRRLAAGRLADPVQLADLAANDSSPAVRTAVAGNPHTPPPALSELLNSRDRTVYRAAAGNPALPATALEQRAKEAEAAWIKLAQQAIQPLIYQVAFSRGKGGGAWLLPAVVVGLYGQTGYRHWRQYRDLNQALKARRGTDWAGPPSPQTRQAAGPVGRPSPPPAKASPPAANGGLAAPRPPTTPLPVRLDEAEQEALDEELKLAESGLEMTGSYYNDLFGIEDVIRIRQHGIVTDDEADIAGYLLEQAQETARRFPGWHDGTGPDDFKRMQDKLRCSRCGLYAGGAAHQCHYPSRLADLRQPAPDQAEYDELMLAYGGFQNDP